MNQTEKTNWVTTFLTQELKVAQPLLEALSTQLNTNLTLGVANLFVTELSEKLALDAMAVMENQQEFWEWLNNIIDFESTHLKSFGKLTVPTPINYLIERNDSFFKLWISLERDRS